MLETFALMRSGAGSVGVPGSCTGSCGIGGTGGTRGIAGLAEEVGEGGTEIERDLPTPDEMLEWRARRGVAKEEPAEDMDTMDGRGRSRGDGGSETGCERFPLALTRETDGSAGDG